MKALLVANFAPDRQESMLRFARILSEGLPAHGIATEVIAPEPVLMRPLAWRYDGWRKYVGYIDKFALFPSRLRQAAAHADVVHILDHGNSAYLTASAGRPTLVTCHDLIQVRAARGELPRRRPAWSGRRFQHWITQHLREAPHVACVSEKTRGDLLRLVPRPPARTHLVYNGLNHPYAPMPRAEAELRIKLLTSGATPPEYYLNVGGNQWYKNRPGLLRIFSAMCERLPGSTCLVMVGKPLSDADQRLARELGLEGRLRHFGGVSNETLTALYSLARGLIFPSWEEGFGWPVAEAQACGCVVFTSDRAPLTEVGGDAAVYFDPAEPRQAAERILAARAIEPQLRAQGLRHAARWNSQRMLRDYATLYHRMTHENPPHH